MLSIFFGLLLNNISLSLTYINICLCHTSLNSNNTCEFTMFDLFLLTKDHITIFRNIRYNFIITRLPKRIPVFLIPV